MAENRQWEDENSLRAYPMSDNSLPYAFLVDASVCVTGGGECSITRVSYSSGSQEWTLDFLLGGNPFIQSFPLNPDDSQTEFVDLDSGVAILLSPGPSWLDPSWRDWSYDLAVSAKFDPSVVTGGPEGLVSLTPRDVIDPAPNTTGVKLHAGYNISFQGSDSRDLSISAIPGAGDGKVPCTDIPVSSVSGVGSDSLGNLALQVSGCMQAIQDPTWDPYDEVDTPNDIWLLAKDCSPCCSDKDYLNLSKAISRMSAKIKAVNDELIHVADRMQERYSYGISQIALSQRSLFIIHSVMIYPTYVRLTIQNISTSEGFAIFGINKVTGILVPAGECQYYVVTGYADTGVPSDCVASLTRFPSDGDNDWSIFSVGSETSTETDTMKPLKPGESANVYLYSVASKAMFDCALTRQKRLAPFLTGSDLKPGEDGGGAYGYDYYRDWLDDTAKTGTERVSRSIVEEGCVAGGPPDCITDEACRHQADKLAVIRENLTSMMWAKKIRHAISTVASGESCPSFPSLSDPTLSGKLDALEALSTPWLTGDMFKAPTVTQAWSQYDSVSGGDAPADTGATESLCDYPGAIGVAYGFNLGAVRAKWRETQVERTQLMTDIHQHLVQKLLGTAEDGASDTCEYGRMKCLLLNAMLLNKLPTPLNIKCCGATYGECIDCGTQVYDYPLPEAAKTPDGYTGSKYGELSMILSLYQEARMPTDSSCL